MPSQERIESILLWGARLPLFLLPFIPLIVTPDLIFPYISGKNFAFRLLTASSLAMYLPIILFYKRYRPAPTPILFSILLFTFVVGVADLFGVNPQKSLWSNYERMEGYITIIYLTVLFVLLQSLIRTERQWTVLLNLFVFCGVIACVYAILNPIPMRVTRFTEQYVGRVYGTLGNPPFLASYLLLVGFINLMLFFKTEKSLIRLTYILTLCLNAVVIYLTASRGAVVALFISMVIFVLLWLHKNKEKPNKKMAIIPISVLAVFIVCLFIFKDADFLSNSKIYRRFHNIFSDPSVMSRIEVWRFAWNGFKERPLLGWGQENFTAIYAVNKLRLTSQVQEFLDRGHNLIIDWTINAGIIGVLSYLLVFFSLFYTLFRKFKNNRINRIGYVTILTAILAYLIQDLFTFDTISTYLIIYTLFAYVDSPKDDDLYKMDNDKSKDRHWLFIALLISMGLFILSSYHTVLKPLRQGKAYHDIMRSYPERYQTYKTLLNDFRHALSYNSIANHYIRRQMVYVSTHILKKGIFDIEGSQEFINETLKEVEKELNDDGDNLEKATLIIRFLCDIAEVLPSFSPHAEEVIKRYISINPDYEWLYSKLADVYILNGEYDKAFEIMNRMVLYDPLNDAKQIRLAIAAIYADRDGVAKSALDAVRMARLSSIDMSEYDKETLLLESEIYHVARAYIKKRDFLKALTLYERLVVLSPNKASYHFDLAMLYSITGNEDKAVAEAERASEIDPINYRERVKDFIKNKS
ncbi:MAG: hypothetical protein Fur0020_05880 [Thermodesulfovibrionia bacterium]